MMKNNNKLGTGTKHLPEDLPMYTREEVAEMIGCHKDHVVMLAEVGCIKCIKIGKRYMFSYDAIKQFQRDYEGLDVSNRAKAQQSFKKVQKDVKGDCIP